MEESAEEEDLDVDKGKEEDDEWVSSCPRASWRKENRSKSEPVNEIIIERMKNVTFKERGGYTDRNLNRN